MLSKMSKTDKTIFRYLGLALLILIVLGTLFGVSSVVKESYKTDNTNDKRYATRSNLYLVLILLILLALFGL